MKTKEEVTDLFWKNTPKDVRKYSTILINECMEHYASLVSEEKDRRIRELEEEQKWISVNDRMPDDISVVSVWSTTSHHATIAHYYNGDWLYCAINEECFWLKTQPHIKILFWQPLPSAPKSLNPPKP